MEKMDSKKLRLRSGSLRKWFKTKSKIDGPRRSPEVSGCSDNQSAEYVHNSYTRSQEMDPCISTNDLRIFVGTWNVGGQSPVARLAADLDEWLNLKDAADMYVLGFQEIVPLKTQMVIGAEDPTEKINWNLLIGKTLNYRYACPWLTPMLEAISSGPSFNNRRGEMFRTQNENLFTSGKYNLMASKKMVGLLISIWMKKELLNKYCISNVKACSVACGMMGYLRNKGSVSISMSIEGTNFCFVNSHLASGEKKGDKGKRNHQVLEILKRTCFPKPSKDNSNGRPLTILGHDKIFWFGDLNYRLSLEDYQARSIIKKQDWKALQQFDQLRREQEGGVFQGWKEGSIKFAPTYKYSKSNGNQYSGSLPSKSGEKQRTPAWCDRILTYGKGVRQLSYFRSESKFSDHRPVSSLFSTDVEVTKSRIERAKTLHSFVPIIITPPEKTRGED